MFVGCALPEKVKVVNFNRKKSRKPLFHVQIFHTLSKENGLGEFGFKIKAPCLPINRCAMRTLQDQPVRYATNYQLESVNLVLNADAIDH